MKLNIKKDNLRSAVFITLSLILMAGSLYVGLVKGRIDENDDMAGLDEPSFGIEDLVTGEDVNYDHDEKEEEKKDDESFIVNAETVNDEMENEREEDLSVVKDEVVTISLKSPVSDDTVVMDYSFDTDPVYSKTFGEYRSDHTGIDLSAKEDEEVFAAAKGVVSKVYEDEKLGFTVVVQHDGFETRYSNLQRGILVKEGEEVTTKTALGRVGSSAVYESAEDSHVHFSLYVDGKCVDPKKYMD